MDEIYSLGRKDLFNKGVIDLTAGEQYEVLRKFERLAQKVNVVLLTAAELLQTLENVKREVKELETEEHKQ